MKNIKIWLYLTKHTFSQMLQNRIIVSLLFIGKLTRIGLFLAFLNFLFRDVNGLAGYAREQIIFFYLTFNLVDTLGQLLFREVYRFMNVVSTGALDGILVKPINPLVKVLFGGADVIDLFTFVLLLIATAWYGTTYITTDFSRWIIYVVLILNAIIISMSFYVTVLAIGVLTTTVDHIVMIYRDLAALVRIPVDLYAEPIRFLLTFAIPLGIMVTFPAKVLMGLLSPVLIAVSISLSLVAILLALKFWNYSLKQYQSASS
jgi:ABC-2 type transport system permease protein